MEKYDIILPSGGRLDDYFARVALTPYKALIKVQDYMVGFKVLQAIIDSQRQNNIVLVAPQEVQDAFGIRIPIKLKETGEITKNISMAIRELKSQGSITDRVLVITTDLPFIEGKNIQDFIDACPAHADVCAALITKDEYLDRFPRAPGTFLKSGGEQYTLGGIFMFKPDVFLRVVPELDKIIANRKSIPKMASTFGFGFLWKVVTRSITIQEIVTKVESIINAKVHLVEQGPAEFAFDIDDIPDYEYALANK